MKLSTRILAVAICAMLATSSLAETGAGLDALAWLDGSWSREMKRGVAIETWVRVSDHTMEGTGSVRIGDESRVSEFLRLERFGEQTFYTAKPNQNPMPTPFELVESGEARFVFENPGHDFPQRIIYSRDGEDGLLVRIEAEVEGKMQGMEFRFERVGD